MPRGLWLMPESSGGRRWVAPRAALYVLALALYAMAKFPITRCAIGIGANAIA